MRALSTFLCSLLLLAAAPRRARASLLPGLDLDPSTVHIELTSSSDTPGIAAAQQQQQQQQIALQRAWAQGRLVYVSDPALPQVGMRIRQIGRKTAARWEGGGAAATTTGAGNESFCDPTVNSWSGYIDLVDGKSLFFYFYESRQDPKNDPVVWWTNGGPGASSAVGLFQEHGPCRVKSDNGKSAPGPFTNGTTFNPHSWNAVANMIYVDQPVGVGYSYSRYGVHTFSSDAAAEDMLAVVRLWQAAFPQFAGNELVWSGESYGGRYLPVFGAAIVDYNKKIKAKAERAGKEVDKSKLVNLKGVLIGNGWTSSARQLPLYYDFLCTKRGDLEPLVGISDCRRMAVWKKKCTPWLLTACVDNWNADDCAAAQQKCTAELTSAFAATGRNVYNAMDLCARGGEDGEGEDCYPIDIAITEFLNRREVREYLGAAPASEIGNYSEISYTVFEGFAQTLDEFVDTTPYVAGLLENGIRVHAFAGKYDFICNWFGFRSIFWEMDWSHKAQLAVAPEKAWYVDGKHAGDSVTVENFTWSTVNEAGHLVPYDQPERALHLFRSWLAGKSP